MIGLVLIIEQLDLKRKVVGCEKERNEPMCGWPVHRRRVLEKGGRNETILHCGTVNNKPLPSISNPDRQKGLVSMNQYFYWKNTTPADKTQVQRVEDSKIARGIFDAFETRSS